MKLMRRCLRSLIMERLFVRPANIGQSLQRRARSGLSRNCRDSLFFEC